MLLWTWHAQEARWQAQPLCPGEECVLDDQARLWVIDQERLLLFARRSVAVNGHSARPIHQLADRDEIAIGTALWCVSFDAVPQRQTFRTNGHPLHCARCSGPLSDGDLTIRCLQCHAHYHDNEDLPCWTYSATCAHCRRPTGGTVWQPAPVHRPSRRPRHGQTSAR